MSAVKISPKYQVVIPKAVRERYSLMPGDKIELIELSSSS
jgi:AbrB family looped-hinge helix DNA binding protein